MKHFIKFFTLLLALLGVFVLAGCQDIMNTQPQAKTGLRISILSGNSAENSGGETGERTLFPEAPAFTKYVLEFTPVGFGGGHDPIQLDANTTYAEIDDLDDGTWIITAEAYLGTGVDEYVAASGSKQITVSSGSFESVNIAISPIMADEGKGTF